MKEISEYTLKECLEEVEMLYGGNSYFDPEKLADRIHELTRWIPVSERMPTDEDLGGCSYIITYCNGYIDKVTVRDGVVKVWDYGDESWTDFDINDEETTFTHWQRITPPEGV